MKKVIQLCLTAMALLPLGQPCAAQEIVWQGSSGFGDTNIRHGMASIPNGALKIAPSSSAMSINTPDHDNAYVVRAFKLADGRSIIYKLIVKRLENGARFEVLIQAHEPTPEQVEKWGIDPARVEKDFLSKYTQPITLNKDDIIALDVLFEPRTGAKLVDYFQFSAGEPITRRNPDKLKAEARALTLEDLILTVTGYEVRRNGEKLEGGGGGVSGRYIWLGIPQVGRAIFTLTTPPEGSGFEQTAIANENQLVFWIDGSQYEWLSKSRIVSAEGSFYIWMKFDPSFSFPPLKAARKVPGQDGAGPWWTHGAFDKLPGEKKED
jgi:hypothetical protein